MLLGKKTAPPFSLLFTHMMIHMCYNLGMLTMHESSDALPTDPPHTALTGSLGFNWLVGFTASLTMQK